MTRTVNRGLLIKSPHIDRILAERKTWEIRGTRTDVREPIALIKIGSGLIVGTCQVVDVVGPLTLAELKRNSHKAGFTPAEITKLPYGRHTFAWVLKNAKPLTKPRPYKHPSGAVRWVKLRPFTA